MGNGDKRLSPERIRRVIETAARRNAFVEAERLDPGERRRQFDLLDHVDPKVRNLDARDRRLLSLTGHVARAVDRIAAGWNRDLEVLSGARHFSSMWSVDADPAKFAEAVDSWTRRDKWKAIARVASWDDASPEHIKKVWARHSPRNL